MAKHFFVVLLAAVVTLSRGSPLVPKALEDEEDVINETLRILTDGEIQLKLDDSYRDIHLMVGNTGAGKTTITKFLTEVESLEAYDAGDRLLIRDKHQKISGNDTIVSKTIFPELMIDSQTNSAFYDLPGFSDTRSAAVEIANAWFMKQVADHARRVKIVFIVNYSSLRSGETRTNFKTFLDHVTDFIVSPQQFNSSLALIVTKVETSRSSERIIDGVAKFLQTAKSSLGKVFPNPQKSKKAEVIIDILLNKNSDGAYDRIAFFRQPEEEGPLANLTEVMESRDLMQTVLYNNTAFTPSANQDFGISISSNAKLIMSKVAAQMNQKITATLQKCAREVTLNFQSRIQSSPFQLTGNFKQEVDLLGPSISELSKSSSRYHYLEIFSSLYRQLKVPPGYNYLTELLKKNEMMTFFENVGDQVFPIPILDWTNPWYKVLRLMKEALVQKISQLDTQIETDMICASNILKETLQARVNAPGELQARLQVLMNDKEALNQFILSLHQSATVNTFTTQVRAYLLPILGLPTTSTIIILDQDLRFQNEDGQPSSLKPLSWVRHFQEVANALQEEKGKLETKIQEEAHQKQMEELERIRIAEEAEHKRRLAEEEAKRVAAEQERIAKEQEHARILAEQQAAHQAALAEQQRIAEQQRLHAEQLQRELEQARKKRKPWYRRIG